MLVFTALAASASRSRRPCSDRERCRRVVPLEAQLSSYSVEQALGDYEEQLDDVPGSDIEFEPEPNIESIAKLALKSGLDAYERQA